MVSHSSVYDTRAALLAIGFLLRFVYHARLVYRPQRTISASFDLETLPSKARGSK